jgi:hypothetical protein
MDSGSPSRHKEKRSKKNQDRAAPKSSGRTKAAYRRGGGAGSKRAVAHGRGGQGASSVVVSLH